MPPDPGLYEERYRLTSRVVLRLAGGLLLVGLGLVWQPSVISATSVILVIPVIFSALTVAFAMPAVITIAGRMIAFRADYVGITLGVMPASLAALRRPAIFIPWAEVEKIILYRAGSHRWRGNFPVQGISVQRRGEPASPVMGVVPRAACTITGWKLNRARLTGVIAAVAPSIPVIDAGEAGWSGEVTAVAGLVEGGPAVRPALQGLNSRGLSA
jgi:hypothetical protein